MNTQKTAQNGEVEKKISVKEKTSITSITSIMRNEIWPPLTIPLRTSNSTQKYFEDLSNSLKNLSKRYKTLFIYNAMLAAAEAGGVTWSLLSGAAASVITSFSLFGSIFATLSVYTYLKMKLNGILSSKFKKLSDAYGSQELE